MAGCSGGGIVAVLLAAGLSYDDAEAMFLEAMTRLRQCTSSGSESFFPVIQECLALIGLDPNVCLHEFGRMTNIEVHLVACDRVSGGRVVLSSLADDGVLLADALRATIAVPFALREWKTRGSFLVDGAVCDPYPLDIFPATRVVGYYIPMIDFHRSGKLTCVLSGLLARARKEINTKALSASSLGVVSIRVDAHKIASLFFASPSEIDQLRNAGKYAVSRYIVGVSLLAAVFQLSAQFR